MNPVEIRSAINGIVAIYDGQLWSEETKADMRQDIIEALSKLGVSARTISLQLIDGVVEIRCTKISRLN